MKSMICKTELPFDEDMHIDAVGGQFIPPSPSLRQFDNSSLNAASLSKTPTNQHDPSLPSRPSPSFHYVRTSKSSGSSSASKKTGQSIVEERRRAAMAIYQSMDLVDTPNEDHLEYHERHLYDRATSRIKSSIDHTTAVSESVSSQSSTENKPLERKSPRIKVASALSTPTNSDMTPRASFKYQNNHNTVKDATLSSISSNQILQDNDSHKFSSSKLAKSSDSSQRKSSIAMASSPSSLLPQVKKKGFLRNMLGRSFVRYRR